MPRIYQPVPLNVGTIVRLDEKASHHLGRVLRIDLLENVTVFNGQGGEYAANVVRIEKKYVEVELKEFIQREVESPLQICLAQGIARGEKMDFIVQKAVELGVSKIVPLITERCNVRLDDSREQKRLAHWQSVVISACEQSGRNLVPSISSPMEYETWLSGLSAKYKFVLSPHASNQCLPSTILNDESIVILIGPEGGLSEREIDIALGYGFESVHLGPRVLRTETATLAAITFFQTLYGDMKA